MARTNIRGDQIADGANGVNLGVDVTGVLPAANGGTGLAAPGASGNVLTSNGSAWTSSAPAGGGGALPSATLSTATLASESPLAAFVIPANSLAAPLQLQVRGFAQVSVAGTGAVITLRLRLGPTATALASRGSVTLAATVAQVVNEWVQYDFHINLTSGTVWDGSGNAMKASAIVGPATAAYAAQAWNTAVENTLSVTAVRGGSLPGTLVSRAAVLHRL